MNRHDFITLLPELIILAVLALVLVTGLLTKRRQSNMTYFVTQMGLLITAIFVWQQVNAQATVALHDMFILDSATTLSKLMVLLCTFFALAYARPFFNHHPTLTFDYCLLTLFAVLGMMTLVSSNHLIPLYLSLELLSLPLYALVTIAHSGSHAEAGMKYFALGAFASALLLYGLSLIYGATGQLDLPGIAGALLTPSPLSIAGIIFVIAGLAFKFGAAPFHPWVPDVYQGAPVPVVALLGSAPKIAVLIVTIRLFSTSFAALAPHGDQLWMVLAIASMALGNIAAIIQNNIRRMLAYSAVAHMGYMMLGFISGTPISYAASLFYVFAYALMTLSAFGALVVVSNQGFQVETIEDLRGLNWRSPWIAFMMLIVMFSMAGIPPSIGFFAKMGVLQALVSAKLTWLAVLALIFAIIGAFYYIRVVKSMYFEAMDDSAPLYTSWNSKLILSINSLLILGIGIFPSFLIDLCRGVYLT